MIRRQEEMPVELRRQMRDGSGEVTVTKLFLPEDGDPRVKLHAVLTIPQGAGIGYHVHEGEQEMFYVLSGEGEYNDNGTAAVLRAGDSCITRSGQGHGVKNCREEPLRLLALILTD